jgi:hypothetical protein
MPTVTCYCQNCGDSFYSKDELYLPGLKNRTVFAMNRKQLKTWDDWVAHLSTHCQECREKEIPESCLEDYKKLKYN